MAIDADRTEDYPRPGLIGRAVRLLLGVLLLVFFTNLLRQAPSFLAPQKGWRVPGGDWWIVALACFWVFSGVLNDAFARRWGRWPQLIYLAMVGAAVAWDRTAYGVLWAVPLGSLVLVLVLYVLGQAGLSFLIAGAAAAPG